MPLILCNKNSKRGCYCKLAFLLYLSSFHYDTLCAIDLANVLPEMRCTKVEGKL